MRTKGFDVAVAFVDSKVREVALVLVHRKRSWPFEPDKACLSSPPSGGSRYPNPDCPERENSSTVSGVECRDARPVHPDLMAILCLSKSSAVVIFEESPVPELRYEPKNFHKLIEKLAPNGHCGGFLPRRLRD
jgi:hypothetical protein